MPDEISGINLEKGSLLTRVRKVLEEREKKIHELNKAKTELEEANKRLAALLNENYEVGKILVRRDMELSEANRHLIALDESKSEFVSVAAHQLRTPLTGVKWAFNELLDKELGKLNSGQQAVTEDGLKSSIRIIDLVNQLLNVARIEEGKYGINPKKQSFINLLKSVAERMKQGADNKGIIFAVDISPDIPLIKIDEEKMGIALENLIDNAIKYTLPGGKVTVEAFLGEDGVKIEISDTGIGIPEEQIERLFSKFFRGDNALRLQTSGTGLGLYVVKNIIEGHDGTIDIESIDGKGTVATITLPCA